MTKAKSSLIEDAKNAGFEVQVDDDGCVFFRRWSNHRDPQGRLCPRLLDGSMVLYASGTAFSLTTPLSVAKGMRSYRDMRRCLGLEN
jgi:hypothetical protein